MKKDSSELVLKCFQTAAHVGRPWFVFLVWKSLLFDLESFSWVLKAGNVWHIRLRCSLGSCFNTRTNRKEWSGSVIVSARHFRYHISYLFIEVLSKRCVFTSYQLSLQLKCVYVKLLCPILDLYATKVNYINTYWNFTYLLITKLACEAKVVVPSLLSCSGLSINLKKYDNWLIIYVFTFFIYSFIFILFWLFIIFTCLFVYLFIIIIHLLISLFILFTYPSLLFIYSFLFSCHIIYWLIYEWSL